MKSNKKAILGMLVSMVMALGVMGGITNISNDANIQQVSVGCAYVAGETEGGISSAFATLSKITAGATVAMVDAGVSAAPATTTNPVGWGYRLTTIAVGL